MAFWETQIWQSRFESGMPARLRRSGEYQSYVPDILENTQLNLTEETAQIVWEAERALQNIPGDPNDLAALSRFLLRSEAIASSRIEGVAPSPKQIAVAELSQNETMPRVKELAQLVANNITVVTAAHNELTDKPEVTGDDIVRLQAALLAGEPELHGIREMQNWIGVYGTPLDADFVPPAPERVPELLDDLAKYLSGVAHSPIVQAALMHAQFETIHPFIDGNGRVGRALIHTVFSRRGATTGAILPVSLILSTRREQYIRALSTFRYTGEPGGAECQEAQNEWIEVFAKAVILAAEQAGILAEQLGFLREQWRGRLNAYRTDAGFTRTLRADSVTAQILHSLPATPVLTPRTAARVYGCSPQAALKALDELAEAGVLEKTKPQGIALFQSNDVLDLLTLTERKLASTQFDTRISKPVRAVPALP
ncbi:MAG: Fic family protein [Microbacteriaceae bacterium]|nr:Fic family protein [Microbacteriaceae bacterium]